MIDTIIGIISGIVSGMGMGGGTILITILVCFFNIEQKIAQSSNLIFFIPTAIVASIINIRNKEINFKLAIPIAILGTLGAIFGSYISKIIDVKILKKLFGIFLLAIAIYQTYSWYNKYIKKT